MSAESIWRCDDCCETIAAVPVLLDSDGDPAGPLPSGVDVSIERFPCPSCREPMRRVVSQGDLRDWAEQFSGVEP